MRQGVNESINMHYWCNKVKCTIIYASGACKISKRRRRSRVKKKTSISFFFFHFIHLLGASSMYFYTFSLRKVRVRLYFLHRKWSAVPVNFRFFGELLSFPADGVFITSSPHKASITCDVVDSWSEALRVACESINKKKYGWKVIPSAKTTFFHIHWREKKKKSRTKDYWL